MPAQAVGEDTDEKNDIAELHTDIKSRLMKAAFHIFYGENPQQPT